MASHTVENYLKALFALANEAGEVGISDLSDHLAGYIKFGHIATAVECVPADGWNTKRSLKVDVTHSSDAIVERHCRTPSALSYDA